MRPNAWVRALMKRKCWTMMVESFNLEVLGGQKVEGMANLAIDSGEEKKKKIERHKQCVCGSLRLERRHWENSLGLIIFVRDFEEI